MKPLKINTSGAGEPLLVLHGWGMNSNVWQSVKSQLEKSYTVSFIDLPGHGDNKDVSASSLEQIVDAIQSSFYNTHTKAHLLGWSLGGLLAQALSIGIPDQIQSLTLVASTPRFSQLARLNDKQQEWLNAMPKSVLEQFSSSLNSDIEGTIKRFIALQFMGSKTSEAYSAKQMQRDLTVSVLNSPPTSDALKTGLKILINSDLRALNSTSSIPRHWVLGGLDRLVPIKVAEDLKSMYPDDQITLFKDAGHAPFMTHPQQFVQSVTEFITKNT